MAFRLLCMRRMPGYLLACALAAACAGAPAAEPSLVLVSSESSPAFEQAASALLLELERGGLAAADVQRLSSAELPGSTALPRLHVALGSPACAALAQREPRTPALCALIPRVSFERIAQDSGRRGGGQLSAVYLDQPLGRQLDLLRLALPAARSVGVLWGPESQAQAAALAQAATARNLRLVTATVGAGEGVFPALKQVLEDSDVLFAVADPQVYNGASIQNILLASFRARVPLLGFSGAYVRAGALLALYVTPEQVGLQVAKVARAALLGRPLPATPAYPRDFIVGVNENVARALGVSLDARALEERLRQMEKLP